MWEDPIVADVRRVRECLSAQFDFDVAAIFADIRSRQPRTGNRIVRLELNRSARKDDLPQQPTESVSDE